VVDELTDLPPDRMRQLLAISGDFDRAVLVPRVDDIRNLGEIQVVQA